eukprot:6641572-Pyramimonas_sp.AAC.1
MRGAVGAVAASVGERPRRGWPETRWSSPADSPAPVTSDAPCGAGRAPRGRVQDIIQSSTRFRAGSDAAALAVAGAELHRRAGPDRPVQ